MMWPFHRNRGPSPDAEAAASQAQRALRDAVNLGGKVDKVTTDAAEIKRINHIAAAVRRSLIGESDVA